MEEGQSLASTPSGDWIFHGLGHKIKTIPSWLKLAQVVAIENLPLEGSLRDSHLQVFVHIWKFSKKSLIFFRGKIKRFFGQFSPHGWIEFQWNPLSSFERYFASEFIWHFNTYFVLNIFDLCIFQVVCHFNTYFVFNIFDPTLCIFQVVCHHLPGHRIPHHWAQHVLLKVGASWRFLASQNQDLEKD